MNKTKMIKFIISCFISSIYILIAIPVNEVLAEETIRDQYDNIYPNIQKAFQAVEENGEMTLYISGSVNASTGSGGSATLSKPGAKVTILSESTDATIQGSLSCSGATSTLVLGNNDPTNALLVKGGHQYHCWCFGNKQ